MREILFSRLAPEYDIVIVGAGPAGCFTAKHLSKDYKVLVVDRVAFPRTKPCGGMLVEETKTTIAKYNPPEYIFTSPKHLNLKYMDWDNDRVMETRRGFLNVSREKFDMWMYALMTESNVDFLPETKLVDFKQNDKITLSLKSDYTKNIKAKFLISAEGPDAMIRRKITDVALTQYLAIQERSENSGDGSAVFIFDNSITDFYSWIIPKKTFTIIGSAIEIHHAEGKFDLFKKKVKERLGLVTSGRVEASLMLRPRSEKEIVFGKDNIMLVGECAGLISPSTGEGISFALRSALNAATAINKGFYSAIDEYSKLCQPLVKEIKKKNEKAKILSDPELRRDRWYSLSMEK